MTEILFDIEVYPKWWCIVYTNPYNKNDLRVLTSNDTDYISVLKKLIYKRVLIGYNIKGYDLRILNAIMNGCDPYNIYNVSQAIINNEENHYNNYSFWNKFNFSDMYDDWRYGSLKEFESNIGMSIVETSVPFDREELSETDKQEIIEYCKYDVKALIKLFEYRKDYYNSKKELSKMYDIPLATALKSTNAKLASIVLNAEEKVLGLETNYILPTKIEKYIKDNLPIDVVNMFNVINEEEKQVNLFGNNVIYGVGGIHSVISNNVYCKSDDNYALIMIDVVSYYPNLMIHYDYMSRNVTNSKKFKEIYDLRVQLKPHKEHYSKQNALKLILNTTYGAMKNKYNKLYDPYKASSLCYTGQLLLSALANELYSRVFDLKIIQTNTDGILIKVHKNFIKDVEEIVSRWEELTNLKMEYDYAKIFYQRDVNNYITVLSNDKVVLKGKWANQGQSTTMSNLNAPVTHRAVLEHYIHDTPIEKTINECNDIFEFCFTTKTGHTYDKTYHFIMNEPHNANKVNRVVATTDIIYGTLKKYKKDEDRYDKIAEIPDNCYLINNELEMIEDLDRDWYINFATKKIQEMEKV